MRVKFNFPRKIKGKHYPKGPAELSDDVMSDWFFKAQVQDGSISIMPKSEQEQAVQASKDDHAAVMAAQAPKASDDEKQSSDESGSDSDAGDEKRKRSKSRR